MELSGPKIFAFVILMILLTCPLWKLNYLTFPPTVQECAYFPIACLRESGQTLEHAILKHEKQCVTGVLICMSLTMVGLNTSNV